MKAGKRILAGILAAVMAFSSPQFSADTAYAEGLKTIQENITGEESAAQQEPEEEENPERKSEQESGQESGQESEQEPGQESEQESGQESEQEPGQESEQEPGQESEQESGQELEQESGQGSEQESGQESEQEPGQGTEQEAGEEEVLDQLVTEPPVNTSGDNGEWEVDETVSENDLQISANTLTSVEETETWEETKIEGAYQFGGAPSSDEGIASGSEPALFPEQTYTDEEVMDYLYIQMRERVESIDVSQYDIPNEENVIGSLVSGVLNEHPDLYYVGSGFTRGGTAAKLTSLEMVYSTAYDDAQMQQGINAALATVNGGMSDLQKAIALHDYLAVNCEYDYENYTNNSIPAESYNTYGVFVNRKAVCQGYALAYKYLLNQVGIDCYMVTSDAMNHAWNLIKLDGQYYQVDVTWDDPVWDRIGRVGHTYMFCSDAVFQDAAHKHHDWSVTEGSSVLAYQATDTRYDSAFWTDCTSPVVFSGSDCYYISPNGGTVGQPALMKTNLSTGTAPGTRLLDIARWTVWNSNGYWTSAFSGLFCAGDRLYFNDKENIYSVAMDGTDKKTVFAADTTSGYLYGSALCQGKVLYALHKDPNENNDAKETVLEADIKVDGVEPDPPVEEDKGLNLANLSAQYTALDGTTIYSAAAGKPKLLIFYSNTCGNCRSTVGGISSQISRFAGADVYAIETNTQPKDAVADFQKQYGCKEITFSYDTGSGNANSMWDYANAAGISGTVSWPVLCYIDADNKLQYVTTSYISADEVYDNLVKYCGYKKPYQITYVLMGGTNNSANPTGYTEKDLVIILQDPVRAGYQFEGWYSDINYSARVTQIRGEDKKDIILYAKWKLIAAPTETPTIDLTPAEGNILMGLSGTYYTETADKILNRLNAIRLEACREGVRNPDTGSPLSVADYVPLQWSADLEAIARQRAAEATVNQDHIRPNGTRCFTAVTTNGEQSWAENLAWNNDGLMRGIEQWYSEKNDWVKQTGKVTGHYTSIISPRYKSVGVGAFRLSSGGWYAVAQEFSYKEGMAAQKDAGAGKCVQNMEVRGENVTKLAFSATPPAFMQEGDTCRLPINVTVQYKDISNSLKSFTGPCQAGGAWSTSNEKVVVGDATGQVTAVGRGTAQITMRAGAQSISQTVTVYGSDESPVVVKAPDLTTYKVGQKINLKGGTVTYPSGNGTKTAALAANMISGFDSAKPGICKVQIATAGYVSGFETLIVEEPKLTAPAGQKLGDIAFPANAFGSYIWQDDKANVIEKAGVYTFKAAFIPNEKTKFQQLSDIQVQVTAQETLGNDTDVTFKANRFVYNGTGQEPKVVVRASDVVLKEGQDYELSYENNRNAGTATVTVKGVGCYLGSISKTFRIQKALIQIKAKDKAILTGAPVPVNSAYEYEVSGLWGTDKLLTRPACICAVTDTSKPGRYDIVPSGADAGSDYEIAYENGRLTVADEYVSCMVTFDVQGHGTAPEAQTGVRVGGTAEAPADPETKGYRFDGWCRDAACTKPWNFETDIVQTDMTLYAKWMEESKTEVGFAFQEIGDVTFTGKACKPAVSVYDGKVPLRAGRDYQIKYYNNTSANKDGVLKKGNGEGADFNPALPYVEIIGKGDYTDKIKDGKKETVKVNFNILQASIGDGTQNTAAGVKLKAVDQLVAANKIQRPFLSIKYKKAMKRDVDFRLHLTVENARDRSGKSLPENLELADAEIPKGYEGTFLLTVEGIGNYKGSVQKTIYVTDKAHLMKNAVITLGKNQKNVVFTGQKVELNPAEINSPDTFTVKYGKIFLKPTRDFTVSYHYNDRVGKAELIVTGNGEYVGTKTAAFRINGQEFSKDTVQVYGIENKVYTGKALTQNGVTLTYGVKDEEPETLRYGTDYTISYVKNINQGSATMTFRGVEKAGYSGSFKKTFRIAAADIADEGQVSRAAAMKNMSFPYCKAGVKPAEEIVLINKDGFTLRSGKDYTLTYKNNKAVADASAQKPPTVTVKGKGNYTGQFDVTFRITKRGLKRAVDDKNIRIKETAVIYNPNKAEDYEYKPAIKLTDGKTALRANTDYVLRYEKNTQADYNTYLQVYEETVKKADPDADQKLQELRPRAVITAQADSNYEVDGEIIVPLPIYQTKLVKSGLQIDVLEEEIYTGDQLTPAVAVRDIVNGKTLEKEIDYTVSYGTNIKSGKKKGSVTVTGIAPEYGGSVTVKFDIGKKAITY